ncbi:MAG: S16 family serine protease, partial [Candidatus Micrarchaeota archaeon]
MVVVFVVLVFFSFGARGCAALSTLSMPAMDSTGKGIITTTSARLVADSSGVFLDTTPFSSVETQQSAENAAKLAARKAGASLESNALLYSVHASAEIIDGPSGGIAFALLAYAEFSGKKPRSDLAVTGSIAQDGSVGKVGGVAEKLEAVHEAGLKIFLIPLGQGVQTGVDLRRLGGQWGMQVIEIANFDEAIAIAFTPTGSQVVAPKHETTPLVLAAIDALPESQSMRFLAENEIRALAAEESELSKKNDDSSALVASALRD